MTVENQYASLRIVISEAIHRQGWKVEQISFVVGARSVNRQDLSKNLKFFHVPEAIIQSMYSKVAMRVFDVYANILKCMYSTTFSGGSMRSETSPKAQATPIVVTPLIRTIDTSRPDKHKRRRKESHEAKDKKDNNIYSIQNDLRSPKNLVQNRFPHPTPRHLQWQRHTTEV